MRPATPDSYNALQHLSIFLFKEFGSVRVMEKGPSPKQSHGMGHLTIRSLLGQFQ